MLEILKKYLQRKVEAQDRAEEEEDLGPRESWERWKRKRYPSLMRDIEIAEAERDHVREAYTGGQIINGVSKEEWLDRKWRRLEDLYDELDRFRYQ